ncbi:hypothetical protein FOL47_001634 [Perkinsus chesapeaki]|uniref:RAP domain-containing protein n=1 Tax=Perkinsus chesapeaki TaxID=330153 RepID=A0A7J6N0L0_PERCH|nr:hypothetical protein FOL47_001634 [Perkinsus chesapeaki]
MQPSRRIYANGLTRQVRRHNDLQSRLITADKEEFEEACQELLSSTNACPSELLCAAGRAVASTKLTVSPRTKEALCTAAGRLLEISTNLTASDVVGTLASLASAGRASGVAARHLIDGLKGHLPSMVPNMSPQEQLKAIAALQKLKEPFSPTVQLLLDNLASKAGLDTLSDFALASLSRTVATSGWKATGFPESLAASWKRRVLTHREVKANVHTAVIFALGKIADKGVVRDALRTSNSSLDFTNFTFTELSQILWVYANNGDVHPAECLWKCLLSTVSVDGMIACGRQTIGYAFWAAGVMSQKYQGAESILPLHLIEVMADSVVLGSVNGFQPSSVSYMVWAAALAGEEERVKSFCCHILGDNSTPEAVGRFKSLELANVFSTIRALGLESAVPDFAASARQYFLEAAETAAGTAANGRAFTQVTWAMVPDGGPEIEAFMKWFVANSAGVSVRSLVRMLWAVSKCDGLAETTAGRSAMVVSLVQAAGERFMGEKGDRLVQQDVGLMAWSLGTLRLSHYDLEDKCCLFGIDMLFNNIIDSRHLSMLLWGITSNSHTSPKALQLIKHVVSAVNAGSITFDPVDVAMVLWAMAALDVYDESAFRTLLSVLSAGIDQLPSTERRSSLSKAHRAYLWAASSHGFVFSSEEVVGIAEALEESQRSSGAVCANGAFQTEVCQALARVLRRSVLPDAEILSEVDLAPALPGLVVDAAIVDPKTGSRVLLIEVDGPHHYVDVLGSTGITARQYNGQSRLKQDLIRRAGHKLLCVEDAKWRILKDPAARHEYLSHEVAMALGLGSTKQLCPT